MFQLFRITLFQKEKTLELFQMYFKTSLPELRILLLVTGKVEEPMGLHLDKEMYLLVTIQEVPVKQVLIILFLVLTQLWRQANSISMGLLHWEKGQ